MKVQNCLVIAGFAGILLAGACSSNPSTNVNMQGISCSTTADCAARGGTCASDGVCHADNECTSNADCGAGTTCQPDPDFGGLCTAANQPLEPTPAWSCTTGKDCPAHMGCSSDGKCHLDGECHLMVQGQVLVGDCTGGLTCAAPRPDGLAGFCTDDRGGGPDPYCRSTGTGQCREVCTGDADCGVGGKCNGGFCYGNHGTAECTMTTDCSPNHVCGLPPNWEDDGYKLCLVDPHPTCVDDGHGACRLKCWTSADCLHGGACGSDGLCHASNECQSAANCNPGELCYPDPEWGGLCGPPRP
jgi:hypothetical protein